MKQHYALEGFDPIENSRVYAGLWDRLLAFIIDALMLGLIGYALAYSLFSYLAELGSLGRLVGFTITLLYFGVGDSSLLNGQTLGKRFLKIQTVSDDGSLLNLAKSSIRCSILAIPFFLNGATFDFGLDSMGGVQWPMNVLSVLTVGLALVIIYLGNP